MRQRRGTTLIEVLVTMGVFALLMIACFVVMRIGTNGWRDVSAKGDINSSLHRFEADIVTDLQRAKASTVNVYTPAGDFHWAVWFQTPMNDLSLVNPSNGAPSLVIGDPFNLITDGKGNIVAQRWVLYYVTRMDQGEHAQFGTCASYAVNTGPDTTCPHKWIVKKDISAVDGTGKPITLTHANIGAYLTDLTDFGSNTPSETGLAEEVNSPNYPAAPGVPRTVQRVKILMQNVVSFKLARLQLAATPTSPPVGSTTGPIILFDVKAFKLLDAQKNINFGAAPMVTVTKDANDNVAVADNPDKLGTIQAQTSAVVAGVYAPYTVQVDTRVVPQNP